ncbi:MAG: IS1634 family transposase, partial [bacterium]|nr:IS1634 family transposase [bacterium]
MYIAEIPNRTSAPAFLLRESFRDGGKVKNRTLANLSHLPSEQIEALFEILRSLPHGHVAAVLGTLRRLQLDRRL